MANFLFILIQKLEFRNFKVKDIKERDKGRLFEFLWTLRRASAWVFRRLICERCGRFAFFGNGFAHIFRQIVSIRVKSLRDANLVASRHLIKRLTCVNQKCLLRSLVMQLVVKLLEPAWTSRLRWRRFFQSPQIQEQNTLKSTFHSLLHSHYVYNTINFSFLLETKSSSFLVLNG